MPGIRHALELVHTPVLEGDPAPRQEVLDRAGDQDLSPACKRRDSSSDVDSETAEIISTNLAFAGVDAGSEFDPQPAQGLGDRLDAPDRPGGTVEGDEKAVPHRLDLVSAEPSKLIAHDPVMGIEE